MVPPLPPHQVPSARKQLLVEVAQGVPTVGMTTKPAVSVSPSTVVHRFVRLARSSGFSLRNGLHGGAVALRNHAHVSPGADHQHAVGLERSTSLLASLWLHQGADAYRA